MFSESLLAHGTVLRPFHHVILSTGQVTIQPRESVPNSVLATLRPVVAAQGGAVPGTPEWFLYFWCPSIEERNCGFGIFQIADCPGQSLTPAMMAIACWEEAISAKLWSAVAQAYIPLDFLRRYGLWHEMPLSAPRTPWLASWLYPWVMEADVSNIRRLTAIAVDVAWALTET